MARLLYLPGALHALHLQLARLAWQQPLIRLGGGVGGLVRQALGVAHLALQLFVWNAARGHRRPTLELCQTHAQLTLVTFPAQQRCSVFANCPTLKASGGSGARAPQTTNGSATDLFRPEGPASPASCAGCAGRLASSTAILQCEAQKCIDLLQVSINDTIDLSTGSALFPRETLESIPGSAHFILLQAGLGILEGLKTSIQISQHFWKFEQCTTARINCLLRSLYFLSLRPGLHTYSLLLHIKANVRLNRRSTKTSSPHAYCAWPGSCSLLVIPMHVPGESHTLSTAA